MAQQRGNPIEALLAEMAGQRQQKPQTPEERREQALMSFNRTLDTVLSGNGCGDPNHGPIEESLVGLIRASFVTDVLPEPVVDAVVRVMVSRVMHSDTGTIGSRLAEVFDGDGMANALLVAGAALRRAGAPDTAGVRTSTGVYL